MSYRIQKIDREAVSEREPIAALVVDGEKLGVDAVNKPRVISMPKSHSIFLNGSSGSRIDFGTVAAMQSDTGFTFDTWLKPALPNEAAYEAIFGRGGNEPGAFAIVIHNATDKIYVFRNGGGSLVDTGIVLSKERWAHIAVRVKESSILEIVVNDNTYYKKTNFTLLPRESDLDYWMGTWSGFTSHKYKGHVARTRFWKQALSDVEFRGLYYNYEAPTPTADWYADDGEGATLTDVVNGYNGNMLIGTSWSEEFPGIPFGAREQEINPLAGLVPVSQYSLKATAGAVNWGLSGQTIREYMNRGWGDRVRQNGEIEKVRFWQGPLDRLEEFYITVWRKNSAGTYDRIAISENIAPGLTENAINLVELNSALEVREGDYTGYRIVQSAPNLRYHALTGQNNRHKAAVLYAEAGASGFDWDAQTFYTGFIMPIECFVRQPHFIFIGGSTIAGHNANDSFLERGTIMKLDSTIPYKVSTPLGVTYQNMGIGGQTTTQVRDRFVQDVIEMHPDRVFINCGLNDIAMVVSVEEVIANYTQMFEDARGTNMEIYVSSLLPWDNGITVQMQTADAMNMALQDLIAGYSYVTFIDLRETVGVHREGGDPGNLWDQNPLYADPDGVHWNEAANDAMSEHILSVIR